MAISLSPIALRELIHRFCNGVEPVHHEVVAELISSRGLAVLHADIDVNKRLLQISLLADPLGKRRVEIVGKLHTLSPSAARTILAYACAPTTSHSRAWGGRRSGSSAAWCRRRGLAERSRQNLASRVDRSLLAFRPACGTKNAGRAQ